MYNILYIRKSATMGKLLPGGLLQPVKIFKLACWQEKKQIVKKL